MRHDIELVQQTHVRVAEVGDKQVGIIGKKRIPALLGAGVLRGASRGLVGLEAKTGDAANDERHTRVRDDSLSGFDGLQRSGF